MASTQVKRVPVPTKLPRTFPPPLRTRLENSLMRSPNEPVPRLLATLENSLHEAGWDGKLTSHAMKRVQKGNEQHALQSSKRQRMTSTERGQAMQHQEILDEVVKGSRPLPADERPAEKRSGLDVARTDDVLRIPQSTVDAAVKMLKEELEKICEVDDDTYVDWRTSVT